MSVNIVIIMAGIDQQGVVSLNGTVGQHVPMYMNMYLSVKICSGLNTVSANITLVNLHLTVKLALLSKWNNGLA